MDVVSLIRVIREPLVVETTFFVLSLSSAFVLFKFLKNTAHIKTTYGNFGGAIAGFIGIFVLLTYSYRSLTHESTDPKFKIPQGFKRFVSKDFKIGFGYPDTLTLGRSPIPIELAFGILDPPNEGQFSVSVLPIKANIAEILNDPPSMCKELDFTNKGMTPTIRCISAREYSVAGVSGVLAEFENTKGGRDLNGGRGYTLGIPHPSENLTYYINFSSSNKEFDKAKVVFEKIVSTLNFLE